MRGKYKNEGYTTLKKNSKSINKKKEYNSEWEKFSQDVCVSTKQMNAV
jgi:hypothetical protein